MTTSTIEQKQKEVIANLLKDMEATATKIRSLITPDV